MKSIKFIILLLLLGAQFISAQQTDIKKELGFFDFSQLSALKSGELLTEVYLEEPLLKMVAGMTDDDEEGVGNMLAALKLVKVQEFMVGENDLEKAGKIIESMDSDLLNQKWTRIVKSRNKNSTANVYVKPTSEGGYAGLVIIALDGKGKASFVNIVGKIDLESVGKLSKQFNLPKVDGK